MQVTTKDFKKKIDFAWNLHFPKVECAKGVFQIQQPISDVNFSNNMSIPQARVNMSETEHDTTFEIS